MVGKRALLSVLSITTFFIANNALAILSVPYGFYIEANGGTSRSFDQTLPANSSTDQAGGIGGSFFGGYKFMPFFALEAGYTRYVNENVKDAAGTTAASLSHYTWDLTFKGILPATDTGFEMFGKLGVQRLWSRISIQNGDAAASIPLTSSTDATTGLYLGVGGQYYFMPEVALVAQWARAKGNSSTGTQDLYSLGVSFIFN